VSGALPERVFGRKMETMGFVDVWLGERIPFSLDRVRLYPLFTPDLLDLMRRALPPDRRDKVAVSVIAKGRKSRGGRG
jgi:hypothetical protein